MNRQIFQGDVLEQLAKFPDCSVDCIISSPPYWGLRDYGTGKWTGGDPKCDHSTIRHKTREERGGLSKVQSGNQGGLGDENKWTSNKCPTCGAIREDNQLGLEPDFHDYLNKMQTIMDELKRILKNTGTCWINLGDTYSTETQTAKSRIGIPERFYINCIDGGWIARNHIIWTKNNCMPSSVKDRFTNKWESVFFFSKNKKYYFDLDAVREPTITPTKPFNARVRDSKKQRYLQKATNEEIKNHNGKGERKRQDQTITRTHNGIYDENGKLLNNPKGKNPGDVFYDKSKPYAVVEREGTIYYRDLPPHDEIRKYLASARKDANLTIKELEKKLGVSAHHWFEDHTTPNSTYSYPTIQDWKKAKEILQFDDKYDFVMTTEYTKDAVKIDNPKGKNPGDIFRINTKPFKEAHFATFPPDLPQKILRCACPKDGIVLDPFFGAGTVGLVAEQMGLQWCGIELNPEYIEIAKKRLDPYTSIQKLEAFA